ncbi:MAG TPA: hypothetical protein VMM77_00195 [Gemmatimonadaceae bacterium]|nr:hypothetical protein [Gemmatimonadaceae bacterium]
MPAMMNAADSEQDAKRQRSAFVEISRHVALVVKKVSLRVVAGRIEQRTVIAQRLA